jgi:hypothetical protein
VGTAEGQLLLYDASGHELKNMKQLQLQKKAITQIATVEGHNLLLALSEGLIYVYALPGVTPGSPITTIKRAPGALMFAVDWTQDTLRIAVALKTKRLLLLYWDAGLCEFVEKRELSMSDTAKSISWLGDNVVVGYTREYVTFDSRTSNLEDRTIEKGTTACSYLMPDGHMLEMHHGTTALIFDPKTGKSIRDGHGIVFNDPPISLAYSFPYILAVTAKGVEIRPYFESNALHQFLSLSQPKFLASDSGHGSLQRHGQGVSYVASRKGFWILQPVPLEEQVEALKRDDAHDQALVLCEAVTDADLPNRVQLVADCKLRIAYRSYANGLYPKAFKYFADLAIDPLILLGLFDNVAWLWSPLSANGKVKSSLLPPPVQKLIATKLPLETTPTYNDTNFKKALLALLNYLQSYRQQNPSLSLQPMADETPWEEVVDMPILLDTCIFLIGVQLDDRATVTQLLARRDNHCHFLKSNQVLRDLGKHEWLVVMLHSKQKHDLALSHLHALASDPNNGSFYGPNKTMDYLIRLGPEWWESVIRKYSEWVILANPMDSYKVFTTQRTKEHQLPPLEVLVHLKLVSKEFTGPNAKLQQRHLITKFLEHQIYTLQSEEEDLHNELAFCYFREVLTMKEEASKTGASGSSRPGLGSGAAGHAQYVVAGSEPGPLGMARARLIKFLNDSNFYSPPTINAARFPLDEYAMFEEKAVLFAKDGQHSAALKIIINQMKEPARAEEYCEQYYHQKGGSEVYLDLFKVLIEPQNDPDDTELNLNSAVDLLTRHSSKIDVGIALELLPPKTKLSRLEPFFQSIIRDRNQTLRENQVVLNILKTESMRVTAEHYKLRNQSVKILPETVCHKCRNRIGEAVFVLFEGKVVHYRCFPQFHQLPNASLIGAGYQQDGPSPDALAGSYPPTGSYPGSSGLTGFSPYLAGSSPSGRIDSPPRFTGGADRTSTYEPSSSSSSAFYSDPNPFGASSSSSSSYSANAFPSAANPFDAPASSSSSARPSVYNAYAPRSNNPYASGPMR